MQTEGLCIHHIHLVNTFLITQIYFNQLVRNFLQLIQPSCQLAMGFPPVPPPPSLWEFRGSLNKLSKKVGFFLASR